MRTPVGGGSSTGNLSNGSQSSQSQLHLETTPNNDSNSLHLITSTSPHGSPKHSPRQSYKKENPKPELAVRDPSPFLEKPDPDQQDAISRSTDSIHPSEINRSISHEGGSGSSGKERKESRVSDRSKKKSSWYNVLYPTYKSRSEEFKRYFKDVPLDERLIVDYSCALQKDILVHGRLYVTQNYLCFYANIFRWETCVSIKWKDVSSVTKEKTALVIPNAILIQTETEKHFFTTFGTRDKAFMMLFRVWQNALMDQPMSTQEMWQWVHTAYGEELGLTSEDEDYNYIPPGPHYEDKLCPVGVRLSADSLSEVYGGGCVEKGGSELCSSATDSTNKSQSSVPPQQGFVSDNTPSPVRGVERVAGDPLPTDVSDNSSESDVDIPSPVKETLLCPSSHEGRHLVNTILPVHVDQLFTLLFTNSKFFLEFHALRRTADIKAGSWQQNPENNEKIRTVSMTVAITQTLGPKSSNVVETQIMQPCSKPGYLYSIDGEVVNNGIPYADSFYVFTHYCLIKTSENETSLNVYAQLKYKKSVWGLVKNLIEKNTWAGLEDFYDALVKSLLAECDDTISKSRKGRRHRGISNKPVLLPVDEIPPSARGSTFKNVAIRGDKEKQNSIILCTVLAILIFLVLLNALLYYKLWMLEDWTKSTKLWHGNIEILKNPPKSHDEWLEFLRHQENLHRTELDRWQKVLQTSIQLLRRAEESLNALQGTIKSPYAEDLILPLNKRDQTEL